MNSSHTPAVMERKENNAISLLVLGKILVPIDLILSSAGFEEDPSRRKFLQCPRPIRQAPRIPTARSIGSGRKFKPRAELVSPRAKARQAINTAATHCAT